MKILSTYFIVFSLIFIFLAKMVNAITGEEPLIINEVMPNPFGDDTKFEWIEIFNRSDQLVNLSDWKLNNTQLPDYIVQPATFVILVKDKPVFDLLALTNVDTVQSNFNLINSGQILSLESLDGNYSNTFELTAAIEGKSFELLKGDCREIRIHSVLHTIGVENTSCTTTVVPTNIVYPTQTYHTTNNVFVKITAFNANPSQGDEWIEITNQSDNDLRMEGWYLMDESKKTYKIPTININSKSTTRIFPSTISLNNDGDQIYLIDTRGEQVDHISYGRVIKDEIINPGHSTPNVLNDEELALSIKKVDNDLSTNVKSNSVVNTQKSIQNILKKPIYYKIGEY